MAKAMEDGNTDLDSESSDFSSTEEIFDEHDDKSNPGHSYPQRKPFVKNESRRFFLLHAVLDQVLSVEAYNKINWVEIAKAAKYEGPKPSQAANSGFNAVWKSLHGGKTFLQYRTSTIESDSHSDLDANLHVDLNSKSESDSMFSRYGAKQVHLLLAVVDDLAGHAKRPTAAWIRLAARLDQNTVAAPRKMFKNLWERYIKIHYPELVPEKKQSRAEKMAEWVDYMHSFDNGDDDEEAPPPYEKHDSSTSKIEVQNKEADCGMMVPEVEEVGEAEETETEEEDHQVDYGKETEELL